MRGGDGVVKEYQVWPTLGRLSVLSAYAGDATVKVHKYAV
jgi:hypothetical protein